LIMFLSQTYAGNVHDKKIRLGVTQF